LKKGKWIKEMKGKEMNKNRFKKKRKKKAIYDA